jgi:hypothetical protein
MAREIRNLSSGVPRQIWALSNQELRSLAYVSVPILESGLYYLALLQWGCWDVIVSDHGAQFESHAFQRVNHRLHIRQELYPKGHPWQNLIESQFGIQKRLGEYAWSRCRRIAEAAEIHRDLIRDHNRLPHWAHLQRNDNKRTPLEVLGPARGRETDAATLHRAFNQMVWRRKTDPQGFIRLGRWRVYVESGLPRTPGR